jgi:hypothetical protein
MSDRIQPASSRRDRFGEYDDTPVNLRNPRSGIPVWVLLVILLPIMAIGVLSCGGLTAVFLLGFQSGKSPPPVVIPVAPIEKRIDEVEIDP